MIQEEFLEQTYVEVFGAKEHNLKNVDVKIPHNSLTVITGLSGSGKSSLAFDTIFAEGQRRYVETFSAYVRNFLGNIERPNVDEIKGLSPVIAIEQKTTNRNPHSTVGTVTEIYDFLRLLYARAAVAHSYVTGEKMVKYTEEQILSLLLQEYLGKKVYLLAPVVRTRKGHYKELFEQIRKKGYIHVRIDGELREIVHGLKLDRYKNHDIEVVIDRLEVTAKDERRLKDSLQVAMAQGDGIVMVLDKDADKIRHFSKKLMCPSSGISYNEPAPHDFSFNSPKGCCPKCNGVGVITKIDDNKIIPDESVSIYDGGIAPLGKFKNGMLFLQIQTLCEQYDCTLKTPIKELPKELLDKIIHGTSEKLYVKSETAGLTNYPIAFDGIIQYVTMQQDSDASATAQKWAEQFSETVACPECNGTRLKKEALFFKILDKNIAELSAMDIETLHRWILLNVSNLDERQKKIATEICKEIATRLQFLLNVGLNYLSLNRPSMSLSGGESQRIRLATQIGSQLVNVLYILDEPSIGLHQRDNLKLIDSLKQLRDMGNTVIVVEHDKDMMLAADYVVDLGPKAGRLGGELVFAGTPAEMMKANTLTSAYINGTKKIEVPAKRRDGNGDFLHIKGATGNNLKHINARFPLGMFICVTGVSGSGKSSLINGTLYPILSQYFYHSLKNPLPYDSIEGLEHIDKVIQIDQSPIGRTPRSNPATYTGIFSDIRNLFVNLPEAQIRGYKPGRFSFNVKGGRCETCKGNGYNRIEMSFLADVYVPCPDCHGKRYNRETLEVRFKGKSIADVLNMTINQAVEFFENVPAIVQRLQVLQDVGLGYIKVGQPSTTLSGGESQRVKLATELAKRDTGKTMYILDEPTTGLHFEDINVLLGVLNRLVDKGNTLIVIEHNLDVIKCADYIIDIGTEGGEKGGNILCEGRPEEIVKQQCGYTVPFLKEELLPAR
jgi:excinuclease ABC subunit A